MASYIGWQNNLANISQVYLLCLVDPLPHHLVVVEQPLSARLLLHSSGLYPSLHMVAKEHDQKFSVLRWTWLRTPGCMD